jgi:hypothetical protein
MGKVRFFFFGDIPSRSAEYLVTGKHEGRHFDPWLREKSVEFLGISNHFLACTVIPVC